MYRYKNNVFAILRGSKNAPEINGTVTFSKTERGVLITSEVYGLKKETFGTKTVFPLSIYNGSCMSLDKNGDLIDGEGYFNPDNLSYPMRAGDLPPLFSCGGYAYMQVVTNRFNLEDIIGKSVIIHHPDEKHNKKIACGIILSK